VAMHAAGRKGALVPLHHPGIAEIDGRRVDVVSRGTYRPRSLHQVTRGKPDRRAADRNDQKGETQRDRYGLTRPRTARDGGRAALVCTWCHRCGSPHGHRGPTWGCSH
jgi:hypothetical protein